MRLINADALYRTIPLKVCLPCPFGEEQECKDCVIDKVMQVIDEFPTVAASTWHRVEEQPKQNGRYLVSWEGAVTTDEYKDGVWLYASMFNLRVTHWMPLPEPPKEDA